MPSSLLDWVGVDHVVWSILSSVEEMELSAFYADYRVDGHGRPAYDPAMMAWSGCCSTRTRRGIAPRAGSSVRVARMSPTG